MRRVLRSPIPIVVLLTLSAVASVSAHLWLSWLPWPMRDEPSLADVSCFPWHREGDIRSIVAVWPELVLLWGLCALLVELVKPAALRCAGTVAYWLLVLCQGVLGADMLRGYAPDWWRYVTRFFGLYGAGPPCGAPPWRPPWLGASTLILAAGYIIWAAQRQRQRQERVIDPAK